MRIHHSHCFYPTDLPPTAFAPLPGRAARAFSAGADERAREGELLLRANGQWPPAVGKVFVVQIDHLETWRVYPDPTDPGRSIVDLDFYVPELPVTESALQHWERNWKLTIDTVINEDFATMAGVQRGLSSGALDSITAGENEPALTAFHRALLANQG